MSTPIPLSGTPRILIATAAWTLILVGLFVMHGAGSHGTAAHASAPVAEVLGSTAGEGWHAGHNDVVNSGDPAQDSEDDGESPRHNTAELCLAILCALLSGVAAFVALTRPRRPLFKVRRRAATALVPQWLRPPDPPSLIRLSILRC